VFNFPASREQESSIGHPGLLGRVEKDRAGRNEFAENRNIGRFGYEELKIAAKECFVVRASFVVVGEEGFKNGALNGVLAFEKEIEGDRLGGGRYGTRRSGGWLGPYNKVKPIRLGVSRTFGAEASRVAGPSGKRDVGFPSVVAPIEGREWWMVESSVSHWTFSTAG